MKGPEDDDLKRYYADFGERLRQARGRRSQGTIATRSGMSRGSISNIEAGRQHIPLHVLVKLATALGVDERDLLPPRRSGEHDGVDLQGLEADERAFVLNVITKSGASDGSS